MQKGEVSCETNTPSCVTPERLAKIEKFRLLDNDFMIKVFEDNKPAVETVLKVILQNENLEVQSVNVQLLIHNLFGHSVQFDIKATDADDKYYDIEIQRSSGGAIAKRARYHSALIDANKLHKNEDYSILPETYVIFICEKDEIGKGRAVHQFERMDIVDHEPLDDKAHIIYVNGAYVGDDDIGKLMSDFRATKAEDMHYPELADRVDYLKTTKEGQTKMCEIMEQIAAEATAKATAEALSLERSRIINLKRSRGFSDAEIAEDLGLSLDYVQDTPVVPAEKE